MVVDLSDLSDLYIEFFFEVSVSYFVIERSDSADIWVLGHLFFLDNSFGLGGNYYDISIQHGSSSKSAG